MEYFVILIIIAIFSFGMIASYIPFHLQNASDKAGFGKFSLKYLNYKIKGISIKDILLKYDDLLNAGFETDFDRFYDYYKRNPSYSDSFIKAIKNSNISNHKLDFSIITEFNLKEDQIIRYSEIDHQLKENNINLPKEDILCLTDSKIDLNRFFNIIGGIKKSDLIIDIKTILNSNIDSYERFLKLFQTAKEYKNFFVNDWFNKTDIHTDTKISVLEGFIKLNEQDFSTEINDLIILSNQFPIINHYTDSIILIRKNQIVEIKPEDITNHLLKGGNPENVITAYIKLKNSGIQIHIDTLFESEIRKTNFNENVDKILYPFDLKVTPEIRILLADGLQITPEILISAKLNSDMILTEPEFKPLFNDINRLACDRIQKFKSYQDLLKEINNVSNEIYSELLKTGTEYPVQLVALRISDIEIIADKLIAVKELEAVEKENELKLKIIEEKKKFQEDLNKALKNGEINYKDYQKEKYIFNSNDDTDLPYHTS